MSALELFLTGLCLLAVFAHREDLVAFMSSVSSCLRCPMASQLSWVLVYTYSHFP